MVDNAKVKDITTKLENIKNGKYRNIANFEYRIDASSGKYSYNFNRLIVVDHSIDKLSDEFEKYPIIDNIQMILRFSQHLVCAGICMMKVKLLYLMKLCVLNII